MPLNPEISYFARTNHRNAGVPFGIRQADRMSHTYIIGQTGVGKSTLIETLALQDMKAGRGFAVIDPRGDLTERLAQQADEICPERLNYFNAPDRLQPYGYNPLRRVPDNLIPLAASGFLETLKKLWPDAWGVRMEHVLRNSLFALLERDGSTLPDILSLYVDEKYRKEVVKTIRNDVIKRFWLDEFENYPARLRAEAVAPIQNKLGALLSDPVLYRMLVEPDIDLRIRPLMDNGEILLVNLSKGQLGESGTHVLGGLIVSTIGLAAFSRATIPASDRRPFFVYIDEFQSFTTLMMADMMSELRKYGIGLILAHQYVNQLEPDICSAVLGNAGTIISFRVGGEDTALLSRTFAPKFSVTDLLNLPNREIYLKLMIAGTPSAPFSAHSMTMSDLEQASSGPVHKPLSAPSIGTNWM